MTSRHRNGSMSWTALGVRMGFTIEQRQHEEILDAIDRMKWIQTPDRPPDLGGEVVRAIGTAVYHHSRDHLRLVGVAALTGGRHVIGLEDSLGTRRYLLALDVEAISVLAEVSRPLTSPGVDVWGVTGLIRDKCALLEEIDCDICRAGSEDRAWSFGTARRGNPTVPVCDRHQITAEVRAAAAEHFERGARALIAQGIAEGTAIAQTAQETIEFTGRAVQFARQRRAVVELVGAYQGSIHRLLRDLGDHLGARIAYVDRDTVEAHLERALSDVEWAAINDQFTGLDFDEHVGDHGTFCTDWIESLLDKAGGPGLGDAPDSEDTVRDDVDQHSRTGGAAA